MKLDFGGKWKTLSVFTITVKTYSLSIRIVIIAINGFEILFVMLLTEFELVALKIEILLVKICD